MTDTTTQDKLEDYYFFQTAIYKIDKKQFLSVVKNVALDSLNIIKDDTQHSELYPVNMSTDFSNDDRVREFSNYVLSTAWNILSSQGYDMNRYDVGFNSMWVQEHHKTSNMEQHVHSDGSQIIAFYFLDTPSDGCKMIIHDPRPGKLQIDLHQENMQDISLSSKMVVITPEAGDLFFTNAWLPHSFSRNADDEPTRFVHMNIMTIPSNIQTINCNITETEVI